MKYILILFALILSFTGCDTYQSTTGNEPTTTAANDTLHIKNDSLEYEIIIIEPGFSSWLVTQQPRGFYGQTFLESKNQMFVAEYNQRVRNFQRYDPNLYQQEINYDYAVDYGYEVNYLLYNYFIYFQQRYNQRFPGSRG